MKNESCHKTREFRFATEYSRPQLPLTAWNMLPGFEKPTFQTKTDLTQLETLLLSDSLFYVAGNLRTGTESFEKLNS